MAGVNLIDSLMSESGQILQSVSFDVFALGALRPNVIVYAVVDVDPARLSVWAGSEVDPDQAASHCRQCF